MKNIKFAIVILLTGAISFLLSQEVKRRNTLKEHDRVLMQVSKMQTPPNLVPMQVRFEEVLSGGSGPSPRISTRRLLSIRSDGSVSVIGNQYTHEGKLYLTHRQLKLAGGISADIIDNLKAVTAYRASDPANEDRSRQLERWNPEEQCSTAYNRVNKRALPIRGESVLGYEAVVIFSADASTKVTKWVVPSLGCLEVRRLAEFADENGNFSQTSDLRAVEIVIGAPSKEVFEIPNGFEHLSPSETLRRENAYRGMPAATDQALLHQFDKFDEQYLKNRYIP